MVHKHTLLPGIFGVSRFLFFLLCLVFFLTRPALASQKSSENISPDTGNQSEKKSSKKNPYKNMMDDPLGFHGYTQDKSSLSGEEEIKIGLFVPVSANHPSGEDILKGATLAIEKANLEGGYQKNSFSLIQRWADDPWGAGSKEMIRFAYEDKVVAVISYMAASSHIAEQVAVKAYLTVITPVSSDPSLTRARVPWIFRLPPSDTLQAEQITEHILSSEKKSRIGLITSLDQDCRTASKEILTALQNKEITPLFHLQLSQDLLNTKEMIKRLESYTPDTLIIKTGLSLIPDLSDVLEASGHKLNVIIPWIPGFDHNRIKSSIKTSFTLIRPFNQISTLPLPGRGPQKGDAKPLKNHNTSPDTHEFYQLYKTRYRPPPSFSSAYAYDAVTLIIKAVRLSGADRKNVRSRISEMSGYKGASGMINWDTGGGNTEKPFIYSIK